MKVQTFLLFVTLFHFNPTSKSAPLEEGNRDLPVDDEPEDRRIRRRKPCRRDADGDGRTFFDWSYSYVNVNHNYIYNCGGSGAGGGGHRPLGGGHRPIGGGHRPLGGLHQGGGHPGGGLLGIHGGGGGIHGGGGGIHGGGGGIHGGGGGIHGGGGGIHQGGGGGIQQGGGNHGGGNAGGGGLFGLGLFNWLQNHRPSTPKPIQHYEPEVPEKPQEPDNPDKPDYNEDKPVSEDYDDVLPDTYQNWKPGQYVTAYNPVFGSYVQDFSNFNPNKIIKQVNREVNKFFRPFYHLLRR